MTSHLREVNESYLQHLFEAWRIGGQSLKAALAAFVHGVFPGLFRTTATSLLLNVLTRHQLRVGESNQPPQDESS